MATLSTYALEVAADPTPRLVVSLRDMLVEVSGIVSGTWAIQLEGSIGGAWFLIATITANGLTESVTTPVLGLPWHRIRARLTASDVGTAVARFAGRPTT